MDVFKVRAPLLSSFFLHAFVCAMVWIWVQSSEFQSRRTPTPIWIEVTEPEKNAVRVRPHKNQDQVVQSELVRKAQEAAPDAFLGQQTQVADRQTVSSVPMVEATSRSKPRAQDQPREQTPKTQTLTKTRPKVDVKASSLSKLGLAILPEAGAKRELTSEERAPMHVPADAMVESRVAREYVKGFKESDRTILNTKEYIFYGYFQRIRQRLDRAWEKSLRDKLEKIYHRGRSLASERDYTTRTLVTLDQTGKVVRVQILEESGTRDLDDAAVRAFNEAGPFPNPPQGLVGVGKAVEIRWDFVLRT